MISRISYIVTFIFLISCNNKSVEEPEVYMAGQLRKIMHEGAIQARIQLDSLSTNNLYALGAIETLKGEITIINGENFIAEKKKNSVIVSNKNASATLLVYSYVDKWDTINTKASDVEIELKEIAEKRNNSKPFAFQVLCEPEEIIYHVINFESEKANRRNHKEGAYSGILENTPVTILGFYSTQHQGIFTHHSSQTHMHFVSDDKRYSGHLESVDFGSKEFKILVPKR